MSWYRRQNTVLSYLFLQIRVVTIMNKRQLLSIRYSPIRSLLLVQPDPQQRRLLSSIVPTMYRPKSQQIYLWPSPAVIRDRKWYKNTLLGGNYKPNYRKNLQLRTWPQYYQYITTATAMPPKSQLATKSHNKHICTGNRFAHSAPGFTARSSSAFASQQSQQTYVMDTCQQLYNSVIDFNNGVRTARLDFNTPSVLICCSFLIINLS